MNVTRREFLGSTALGAIALALPASMLAAPTAVQSVLVPEPVPFDLQPAPARRREVIQAHDGVHDVSTLHLIPSTSNLGDPGRRLQLLAKGFKVTVPAAELTAQQPTSYMIEFSELIGPHAAVQELLHVLSDVRHQMLLCVKSSSDHDLNFALLYRPMVYSVGTTVTSQDMSIVQSLVLFTSQRSS